MISGELLNKQDTISSRLVLDPGSSSSLAVEEIEDGILLEKPDEIKDNNLTSLLPSITAVVTAYIELKSGQFFGRVKLADIPLSTLQASSVKDEQSLRAVIIELKKDKKNLAHGAVRKLDEILSDGSVSSAEKKEQGKTTVDVVVDIVTKKAEQNALGYLDVPVRTASAIIETWTGTSLLEQKKIVLRLVSAATGETKAQHIVEIIDSCIRAKDCQGNEDEYAKLIARVKEIENIHVPSKDNIRRRIWGRKVIFETVFFQFCENAIILIENIKKSKFLTEEKLVNVEMSTSSLLANLRQVQEEIEQEKKINQEKEQKSQARIMENTRDYEIKLERETKALISLKEEFRLSYSQSSALIQNNNDLEEFFNHTIELKDSQNKCFLLFAATGGSSGLCFLFGVGISAWWLIPVGLFIGGVYYACASYKEHLQAEIFEEKVTLQKKDILKNSTGLLLLKLKNQEQKSGLQPPEIKSCLSDLDELLELKIITNSPKKIQQEIYRIFQNAIDTLKLESLTEENVRAKIHGACETLIQKRQRNEPYFFGKTQHREIDRHVSNLKEQVTLRLV